MGTHSLHFSEVVGELVLLMRGLIPQCMKKRCLNTTKVLQSSGKLFIL